MHCQTSLSDTSSPPKKRTIKGYGSSASISNGNNKSVLFFAHEDFNIVWLSNPLTLSVPDEGYSRNLSCAFNYKISAVLF